MNIPLQIRTPSSVDSDPCGDTPSSPGPKGATPPVSDLELAHSSKGTSPTGAASQEDNDPPPPDYDVVTPSTTHVEMPFLVTSFMTRHIELPLVTWEEVISDTVVPKPSKWHLDVPRVPDADRPPIPTSEAAPASRHKLSLELNSRFFPNPQTDLDKIPPLLLKTRLAASQVVPSEAEEEVLPTFECTPSVK